MRLKKFDNCLQFIILKAFVFYIVLTAAVFVDCNTSKLLSHLKTTPQSDLSDKHDCSLESRNVVNNNHNDVSKCLNLTLDDVVNQGEFTDSIQNYKVIV
jgi:hypothetical protein